MQYPFACSHQTGWTALVANCLYEIGKKREQPDFIKTQQEINACHASGRSV